MPTFWGRGAEDSERADTAHPVRRALERAIARGEAGPPWKGVVGPWRRREGDEGSDDETLPEHPAGYIARIEGTGPESGDGLVHAVNAALMLGKPLLLTGSPGTGKSQLAERLAWEFNLSPVLRFESQSLSEADDPFYRYDLVGRLAAVEAYKAAVALGTATEADRRAAGIERQLRFGPLGRAILQAQPEEVAGLVARGLDPATLPIQPEPRRSVVLIDEIDKTSRDFPNDLLNAIERKEFKLRELGDRLIRVPDDESLHPIVVITSNSERELPPPFLRRCIYYHIPDPTAPMLARILRSRVTGSGQGGDRSRLHPVYADVLELFDAYQRQGEGSLTYRPGTSELLDLSRTLARSPGLDPHAGLRTPGNYALLRRCAGTLLKHRADRDVLESLLAAWKPS